MTLDKLMNAQSQLMAAVTAAVTIAAKAGLDHDAIKAVLEAVSFLVEQADD